eukprot:scaffold4829_cov129-Cylindrotheca_fusiformis.AAC.18
MVCLIFHFKEGLNSLQQAAPAWLVYDTTKVIHGIGNSEFERLKLRLKCKSKARKNERAFRFQWRRLPLRFPTAARYPSFVMGSIG